MCQFERQTKRAFQAFPALVSTKMLREWFDKDSGSTIRVYSFSLFGVNVGILWVAPGEICEQFTLFLRERLPWGLSKRSSVYQNRAGDTFFIGE
jgi:hypothetical protein